MRRLVFLLLIISINSIIKADLYSYDKKELIPVNILLLLPLNETYKFSLNKVLLTLNLAINEIKTKDFGSKFEIDITPDSCDCTSIKAPINAMENIYRKRNHTKRFQAVFGPMCD
jgi:hypothetical protein